MRRVVFLIALAAIFLSAVAAWYFYQLPQTDVSPLRAIQLSGQMIRVSVADTEALREKGLSGRAGLAPDEGMLFVFPKDGKYAFWMKDMHFPIDVIWLSVSDRPSRDGSADPSTGSGQAVVVYMAQNVSPDSFPQTFRPDVLARYVLELPAGYAKEYNVVVGDIVWF